MRIHLQRKLVASPEEGGRELVRFDRSAFPEAIDVQIELIRGHDGLWLTIAQETAQELDEVPILPGWQRMVVGAPKRFCQLH